jgi:hypothetical protein
MTQFHFRYFVLIISTLAILLSANTAKGQEPQNQQGGHSHYDSTENHLVIKKITPFYNTKKTEKDSSFTLFHIFRPSQQQSVSISQLGNIGLPTISNIYHDRLLNYEIDFMFNAPFDLYLQEPNEVSFYNTRRPYTNIIHTSGTKVKDEQTIGFTHSQNVNPRLNFTFDYDLISSTGQYPNQKARNSTLNFNSNYQSEKYSVYAALNMNKFDVQNNGGIIDTGFVDINSPETHLSEASTLLSNNHLFLLQEYRIGSDKTVLKNDSMVKVLEPLFKFTHFAAFTRRYRIYKDNQSFENGFYTNFYIEKDQTMDSVFLSSLQNVFAMHTEPKFTQEKNFGFDILLSNKRNAYYNFQEYIFLKNKHIFWDTKIAGNIYSKKRNTLSYNFSGEYYFTGYRMGDHKAAAEIKHSFSDSTHTHIILNVHYSSAEPDYFLNTFYSNHFRWENDFSPEINARADLSFAVPQNMFRLTATASAVQNYTFFSGVALPMQFSEWMYVYSASLKKDFNLGRIRFFNEVVWQESSNPDIINLPALAAYHSTSVRLRIEHALVMYAGFDIQYSTKYKAYSFMPGHGMFYFENNFETGNYPIASVYINGKIKEDVLFFIKFSHINSNILTDSYYTVKRYPINNRMFKFGVQWTFNN